MCLRVYVCVCVSVCLALRDEITFTGLNKTKVERILRRLIELPDRFIIRYNDKIYTLSDVTKDRLLNNIDTLYVERVAQGEGSDAELIDYIMEINEMTIQKITSNYEFREGAFFRYTHNMKGLDLASGISCGHIILCKRRQGNIVLVSKHIYHKDAY